MFTAKTFLQFVGYIFSVIGGLHFMRLLTGWQIVLAGWVVPLWISIVGVIVAWYLAYNAFSLAKKKNKK